MNYENKMMTTATGKVGVTILDDEMKRCQDEVLRKYELTGQNTKEALEAKKLLDILMGRTEG